MLSAWPGRGLRIRLGAMSRGVVAVLCEVRRTDDEMIDILNGLAEHGYSSTAIGTSEPSVEGTWLTGARCMLADLAQDGWRPPEIGILGYGAGAAPALQLAVELEIGAAVSLASASGAPPKDGRLRTPWLGLYAQDDRCLDAVRALLAYQPVYGEVVRYPAVTETFYRRDGDPDDHWATFDSWQRTLEFLNSRVAPPHMYL